MTATHSLLEAQKCTLLKAQKCVQLPCLQFEVSCLQFSFFAYSHVLELTFTWSFFLLTWSFIAYSGSASEPLKVMDCKQANSTVSRYAPAVTPAKKVTVSLILPPSFPIEAFSLL